MSRARNETFVFTPENEARVTELVARYPEGRQASAVLPLLDLAQRQAGGWLPPAAIRHVGERLGIATIRMYEVATFYTMFNLKPVGRHLVQVCTTTPCWLRGSDAVLESCRRTLGIGVGATSVDGKFTLVEVECLGACVNAPMVQIDDDYYEDLDADSMRRILEALREGRSVAPGPQIVRQTSAPVGGPTTLKDLAE